MESGIGEGARIMKSLRTCRPLATTTSMAVGLILAAAPVAAARAGTLRGPVPDARRACAVIDSPRIAACMALIRTDVRQRTESFFHGKTPTGFGYGPSDLASAYDLPSSAAVRNVAVVDAYNDPAAVSNLAAYRSSWGLPACNIVTGAGCLTVTNQSGATSPLPPNAGGTGWATEESLDVDMVSAICPSCHIFLVEATSPTIANLGTGVNSAVSVLSADYVSNSYGMSESSAELGYDTSYYKHAGVAVTASAGDDGYGVSYPAASQWVTAVGGTTLTRGGGTRGWTETVWGSSAGGAGTGSGCSTYEPKPSVQTSTACGHRIDNDVSAVADPATGVAVYDTYDESGWLEAGGTSVSSPIIAAVFALGGVPAAGTYPSTYPYLASSAELNDVTSGANGTCTAHLILCHAGINWDAPSGCGTPHSALGFTYGPRSSAAARWELAMPAEAAARSLRMPGPPC
jgi:hypothetical protein